MIINDNIFEFDRNKIKNNSSKSSESIAETIEYQFVEFKGNELDTESMEQATSYQARRSIKDLDTY